MKQLSELLPGQLANFKLAYAAYAVEQMDTSTMERIIMESLVESLDEIELDDIQQQAFTVMGEGLYEATYDTVVTAIE